MNFVRLSGDDFLSTDGFDVEHSPAEVTSWQINFTTSFFTSVIETNALDIDGMSPKASCLPYVSKVTVSLTTLEGEFGY